MKDETVVSLAMVSAFIVGFVLACVWVPIFRHDDNKVDINAERQAQAMEKMAMALNLMAVRDMRPVVIVTNNPVDIRTERVVQPPTYTLPYITTTNLLFPTNNTILLGTEGR